MNILLLTTLNETSAAFAEKLSETNHVTVWHPNDWPMENSFSEKRLRATQLLRQELSSYGAVLVLLSAELPVQYLECLLERVRQWPKLPCICFSPCAAAPREGFPTYSAEEALCKVYAAQWNLNTCFVKVPAVYGDDFLPDDVMTTLLQRPASNRIELSGREEDTFDLMHVLDLASLVSCFLEDMPSAQSLEIGSAHAGSIGDVGKIIQSHFRLTDLHFVPHDMPSAPVCKGNYPGWMPQHSFLHELPQVLLNIEEMGNSALARKRRMHLHQLGRFCRFMLFFACVCLYTSMIKVSSELQFVDMRLLFVVGVSLYLGRYYGLAAGVMASSASVIEAILAGTRWHVIFFHIDNWIPMAVYLATAVLLGMYSENHRPENKTETTLS